MGEDDITKRLDIVLEHLGAVEPDREFWRERFSGRPVEVCEQVLELFVNFPGEFGHFTEFEKKKEKMIAEKDREGWRKLVEEEAVYIESLLSQVEDDE